MPKPNRFANLMEARQPAATAGPDKPIPAPVDEGPARKSGAGRPRTGKRSNPDYKQISAIIRKDTHRAVTRALFDEGGSSDASDLMQELLEEWLAASEERKISRNMKL